MGRPHLWIAAYSSGQDISKRTEEAAEENGKSVGAWGGAHLPYKERLQALGLFRKKAAEGGASLSLARSSPAEVLPRGRSAAGLEHLIRFPLGAPRMQSHSRSTLPSGEKGRGGVRSWGPGHSVTPWSQDRLRSPFAFPNPFPTKMLTLSQDLREPDIGSQRENAFPS